MNLSWIISKLDSSLRLMTKLFTRRGRKRFKTESLECLTGQVTLRNWYSSSRNISKISMQSNKCKALNASQTCIWLKNDHNKTKSLTWCTLLHWLAQLLVQSFAKWTLQNSHPTRFKRRSIGMALEGWQADRSSKTYSTLNQPELQR